MPLARAEVGRFADGEVSIKFHQSLTGQDVFIIQSCAAPVNDSIMELLLLVSCARRAGANRVTTVIPYYGYKHHRRGSPISTKLQSRFLSSGAIDFAKMLQEMGVDRVIAVDLQRPGQGHEACFFDNAVPLEVLMTSQLLIKYVTDNIPLQSPIVVVTPNAECVKKARNFQVHLKEAFKSDVKLAFFVPSESGTGPADISKLELLGKAQVGLLTCCFTIISLFLSSPSSSSSSSSSTSSSSSVLFHSSSELIIG